MTFGIGGAVAGTSHGVINFTTAATLAGVINTVLINNFTPASGATFTPLKYLSKTGAFATSNLNAGNGVSFTPTFGATSLSVKAAVVLNSSVANRGGPTLSINGKAIAETITVTSKLGVVTASVNNVTSVFAA